MTRYSMVEWEEKAHRYETLTRRTSADLLCRLVTTQYRGRRIIRTPTSPILLVPDVDNRIMQIIAIMCDIWPSTFLTVPSHSRPLLMPARRSIIYLWVINGFKF
jgi:hypothetical protein